MGNICNGFWRFSCRVYAEPGISESCLTLQDRYGLDVNLLLFSLWLATNNQQLSPSILQQAAAFSRRWQRQRVRPLRELRRKMKASVGQIIPDLQQNYLQLRKAILTTELEAERVQQAALERIAALDQAASSTRNMKAAMLDNLHAVCAESGVESDAQLQPLLVTLVSSAASSQDCD